MAKQIHKLAHIVVPLVLFTGFLLFTDPYRLPLPLLGMPFILLAIVIYRVVDYTLDKAGVVLAKRRTIAGVITAFLLLLALLQSTRQLSIKDLLIVAALLIGLAAYLRRLDI